MDSWSDSIYFLEERLHTAMEDWANRKISDARLYQQLALVSKELILLREEMKERGH